MSPVQTRSRKGSLLPATTMKEMVLLKQSSARGGVIHLRDGSAPNTTKGMRSMSSPIAISTSRTRSSSSSSSTKATALKRKGQGNYGDIEKYKRAETGLDVLENACSISSSSKYASAISPNDVVEGSVQPSECWDEESCSTPKAIEFRIPGEACLACPPAPRKQKAASFHLHHSFFPSSPPLLPHYIAINNIFDLSAEDSTLT